MSEAKDSMIKLFRKMIPVSEVQANGSGECSRAPSSCSGPLVDDNIDQDRASLSNSSAEKLPKPQPEEEEEEEDESSIPQSKKAAKKEAAKLEKLKRRQEAAVASGVQSLSMEDPLADNYGDVPLLDLQSKVVPGTRVWTEIGKLAEPLKDQYVLVRGRAQRIRAKGKTAFVILRERGFTVQCVLTEQDGVVSRPMLKYAAGLSRKSVVDVEGVVSVPGITINSTTQQVEIQVRKIFCVNKAMPTLPINVEDAARSDVEIEKALQNREQLVRVNQDTCLNYRDLDIQTPANQGIFLIQCQVGNVFRQFLLSEGFVEIQTPKLIAGSSEGGASVFKLDYKGKPACLAQSPQLHKQMAICGDFGRVFEIGAVFRVEDSTRHLCEFTGLDVEMEIKEHYFEVMDVVDRLLVAMFDSLNNNCAKELEAVGRQYPFEPLKYLRQTLRLTFEDGIQMLKDAGVEVDPLGDLNTEAERKLGQLVLEKYDTEFYILHRYPLAVRPFYTMPCYDNPTYSNSFDVFIRGVYTSCPHQLPSGEKNSTPSSGNLKSSDSTPASQDPVTVAHLEFKGKMVGIGASIELGKDASKMRPARMVVTGLGGVVGFSVGLGMKNSCGDAGYIWISKAGLGLFKISWDKNLKGEEIISGAQRVHVPDFLVERAQALGIDVQSISTYVDSFRYGAPPHGGFGVGLERVVMLFCGLNNIRKTSLFPS
uniref:aspartate--tRNA ligase n=1 Tax=Quercus lobata TaxID=97700 RepID=A0A7N2N4Y4_QUELO